MMLVFIKLMEALLPFSSIVFISSATAGEATVQLARCTRSAYSFSKGLTINFNSFDYIQHRFFIGFNSTFI